jgi:predicted ATPase/class 3 adenylate cyclase
MTLPSGTVTFLFTDIEDSTRLWQEQPEPMSSAHAQHDAILREAIESNHGYIFQIVGDSFSAAFHNALDGLRAALAAQRDLEMMNAEGGTQNSSFTIPHSAFALKVRMGLHTGTADLMHNGKYDGYVTVASTQRVMSAAHGGQVLISQTTFDLLQNNLPENTSLRDLGEHQLKSLSAPQRLYQLVAPHLQQDFPSLKSIAAKTDNLPAQLTSFIGRERELAEARSKLEDARLLTLIGPGGTGKTRLSIQLGTQLLSNFKDGVWLVELAPISDPSLVVQTIASVFGISEIPGVLLKDLVHDYLRAKHLLLILDNCEHLVESSARVADELLHIAPKIKIIASSREVLGISGETVYRVPSLSLPEQATVTREAALGCESVQLFVERASAANPKFQLTDANASSVAEICSRLDGIPLAIELAASRITVFSSEQIAKRLDNRFKLLTGGSRTALPRQQTLRALIDWSYELLSEDERALLRRLSVFAGGWTFEAAETICNNVDVFEHLPQLVNKSLVVMKDEGNEPRYFLLETIRQYGRDKLLENREGEGTRNRHFEYYLEMAETAFPTFLTRENELEWLRRLRNEDDNIRTAIEWGLSRDPVSVMRMLYSLSYSMVVTSFAGEGHRWCEEALKQVDKLIKALTKEEEGYRARLLVSMSVLSFSMGDSRTSYMEAKEAANLLRTLGDKLFLGIALSFLMTTSLATGNPNEAILAHEEALEVARELEGKYVLGSVLISASLVEAFVRGNFSKAYELHEEGTALLKEHGSRWTYGIAMYAFGNLASSIKDFETARKKFNIAMQTMQELGSKRNVLMIQSDLAHILRHEGKYPQAISAYHETIREWQRLGHRAAVAHQLESLAFIAKSLEQTEKSAQLLGAAEALRESIGIDMTPQEREEYEKEVADLKANMDEKAFSSHWAEGRSMTMEQAIELALMESK